VPVTGSESTRADSSTDELGVNYALMMPMNKIDLKIQANSLVDHL
jgi:hypothetical protein